MSSIKDGPSEEKAFWMVDCCKLELMAIEYFKEHPKLNIRDTKDILLWIFDYTNMVVDQIEKQKLYNDEVYRTKKSPRFHAN